MSGSAIVEICRRLYDKNFLAAADGNVSMRLGNDQILMTPTQRHKGFLKSEDLATLTVDGEVLSGKPSGERLMHLAVYRRCPKARAAVHAHPPCATAWSIARSDLTELPADAMGEVILAVGRIPIVPYARPGTAAMGTALEPFLPDHRALILARHGAITWGESLEEAYWAMERLEHAALILKTAQELGGLTALPADEVQWLRAQRQQGPGQTL